MSFGKYIGMLAVLCGCGSCNDCLQKCIKINPLADGTPVCTSAGVQYDRFTSIDLTPYGGTMTTVSNDQDVINAFAALGITVSMDGCSICLPEDYEGEVVDVDPEDRPAGNDLACDVCSSPTLGQWNGLSGPNQVVMDLGSNKYKFSNSPQPNYQGNDVATSVDVFYDYQQGLGLMILPDALSSVLDFSSITESNPLAIDGITRPVMSFVSDSGLDYISTSFLINLDNVDTGSPFPNRPIAATMSVASMQLSGSCPSGNLNIFRRIAVSDDSNAILTMTNVEWSLNGGSTNVQPWNNVIQVPISALNTGVNTLNFIGYFEVKDSSGNLLISDQVSLETQFTINC